MQKILKKMKDARYAVVFVILEKVFLTIYFPGAKATIMQSKTSKPNIWLSR
jgi:hypothetical protein